MIYHELLISAEFISNFPVNERIKPRKTNYSAISRSAEQTSRAHNILTKHSF